MDPGNDRSLYIDGQVFQSAAWHRGMGRYSLNLMRALSRASFFSGYGQVKVILRAGGPEEPQMEPALRDASPVVELVRWDLSDRVEHAERNKRTLERNISADQARNPDFLILSLFLESAPVFPYQGRKMLIVYDLIPLLYPRLYGRAPRFFSDYYLPRFKTLFEADLLFPISQTIGQDLITHLGIPAERIKPIGGGGTLTDDGPERAPNSPGLDGPFVLMPSGDELRKNNVRGALGFQRFVEETGAAHRLVVTSEFTEDSIAEMNRACSRLLFTGNVSDPELRWLFKQSELVFFPTEYEGLGLPVLEAVRYEKPVAGSDIPSFREMSPSAFYFFDPMDADSIAKGLQTALAREDFNNKLATYASILESFSWQETARRFAAGAVGETVSVRTRKPWLAVLAPSPSASSAIARTVARSHGELSKHFEIEYFFEASASSDAVRPDFLAYASGSLPSEAFNTRRYANYDAVLYHIGNTRDHLQAIEKALHLPGFVVLYDSTLDVVFPELARRSSFGSSRIEAEAELDPQRSFLTSLVNGQLGIFCHMSETMAAIHSALIQDVPTRMIPIPVPTPPYRPWAARQGPPAVGIPASRDLPTSTMLQELSRTANVEVFGDSGALAAILPSGASAGIRITKDPSDHELEMIYERIDVLVDPRSSSTVGTRAMTLDAMRHGVPVAVLAPSRKDALPDEAVIQADGPEQLVVSIERLLLDADRRSTMGDAARAFVRDNHSAAGYSVELHSFISDILSRPPTINGLIAETLRAERSRKTALGKVHRILSGGSGPSG